MHEVGNRFLVTIAFISHFGRQTNYQLLDERSTNLKIACSS